MAKLERTVNEDFNTLLSRIDRGIMNGSISASAEAGTNFSAGDVRCAVRVYERYSMMGSNRVSLTVTLFQPGAGRPVRVSGITSGGSQGTFLKINTWGEESFLRKLEELL